MSEIIKATDSEPIHFAIEALTLMDPNWEKVPRSQGELEIEFKINGVDVPFGPAIKEIYRREEVDLNKRAFEIAMDKIKGNRILDLLQRFEFELKDALAKEFGVEVSWDD